MVFLDLTSVLYSSCARVFCQTKVKATVVRSAFATISSRFPVRKKFCVPYGASMWTAVHLMISLLPVLQVKKNCISNKIFLNVFLTFRASRPSFCHTPNTIKTRINTFFPAGLQGHTNACHLVRNPCSVGSFFSEARPINTQTGQTSLLQPQTIVHVLSRAESASAHHTTK